LDDVDGNLFAYRSIYRTYVCAGATIDALVRVDSINRIAFRYGLCGAFGGAGSAGDAGFVDYISHDR